MTQQELILKTLDFVKIESTASNPAGLRAAVAFVADMVRQNDHATIEQFEQNGKPSFLAYAGPVRPACFDVLLCAHVDVVPGKAEQFTPFIADNKLFGRGTYDMKMATLIMADVFTATLGKTDKKIGFMVVSDEEVGGNDGAYIQLEQGVTADFAIYGEMTNLEICTETRGICWAELSFTGTTAHGGYPWDGDNAITKAGDYIQALLKQYPIPTSKQWCTTVNVSALSTPNDTHNIVPDTAHLKLDIRYTPADTNFATPASSKKFLESLGFSAKVQAIPIFGKGVKVEPNNPHLQDFVQSFKRHIQGDPAFIKRYASSDTRFFANKDIPCIEIGLSGDSLHGDTEYVDLASAQPYKNLLLDFILAPKRTTAAAPAKVAATAKSVR